MYFLLVISVTACLYSARAATPKLTPPEEVSRESLVDAIDGAENPSIAGSRFRRLASGRCNYSKIQCRDGFCIDSDALCDGVVDCPDRSDETQAACGGKRCPAHLFRCSYGACVDGDAKCNGVHDCADGSDEVNTDCVKTTTVKKCVRGKWQCDSGQCIDEGDFCDGTKDCSDSSDETVAQCFTRKCKSFQTRCAYGACVDGDAECNNMVECADGSDEDPMRCTGRPGWVTTSSRTDPTPTLRPPPATSPNSTKKRKQQGSITQHHPQCGLENRPPRLRRIVNGADAIRGAFPWHVGIYHNVRGIMMNFCGGTLLKSNVVISAALCFYDPASNVTQSATMFKVAIGKIYRSWDSEAERDLKSVQKSKVKQIFVHEGYAADKGNYQYDVALLELMKPVRLSAAVMPVCIDLVDEEFDKRQLEPRNIGKVAGWGATEIGRPWEPLKTLRMPVVGLNDCTQRMSMLNLSRFLTTDKLCAGYINGTGLNLFDEGGGLVFPAEEKDQPTRWFLRAVASTGSPDTYDLYTHIFALRDWISRQLLEIN